MNPAPGGPLAVGPDRDGRVLIAREGRVVHFGPPPGGEALAAPALEAAGALIRPGRINAHTHVYSGLAPFGMPAPAEPPRNFLDILERVWWRLDRALDAATLHASAKFYAAEALLAGTTSLIDHHESPAFLEGSLDVVADACQELGIRALLTFGATERNGGREEGRRGLAECRRFLAANRRPGVGAVVGLHASFTVSDETAREAGALARELGTVVHVHLAEDGADLEDARRRGWPGPLERLLALEALPPGSILAHGVWCTAEQVRRAAEAGLWFVHNPRSNRGNRVGYAVHLAASPKVALGTDGYPSRMGDEVAALLEEAAAHGQPEVEVRPRIDGGHALAAERFGAPFAPLAPGAVADAVVLDPDGGVRHTVVAGRPVVVHGRLVTADHAAIRAEAEEQAARLWQRMAAL